MHDTNELEAKRTAIITYYQGESRRLEQQAIGIFRFAGQCLAWSESVRSLPPDGVEYVFGVVERAKAEQAQRVAGEALASARIEACRQP